MSRIDTHVAAVQRKLMLGTFIEWLALSALVVSIVALLLIITDRLLRLGIPIWSLYGAAGAILLVSLVMCILRRPSKESAAVAIDQRLNLQEKFSTALTIRRSADPFAQAAVKDAEHTAQTVNLSGQFPLSFPNVGYWAIGIAVIAALSAMFIPPMDLFGREAKRQARLEQERQLAETKQAVREAIAKVEAMPRAVLDTEAVRIARRELEQVLNHPNPEKPMANRRIIESLSKVDEALKQKANENSSYAQAKKNETMFRNMTPPQENQGPVAEAHRQIAKGDFEQAAENLKEVAKKFDKMDEKEKEQAAKQMQQLQQALQQMAKDPKAQEKMQQQLQQAGANQQQIQQAQQLMQQAAQGNQQAQQQLQQMAQKLAQQMNNGQGANQQQMQQLQQAMQQAQQAANAQQQAQQMQQAAQQMAQAMQQQQQGGQQQGQQGQNGQQQLAQGQQQMQEMLDQLDAMQKDQQQMQAAQQQMQQGMNKAGQDAGQQGDQGQPGENPGQQQGQGQWAQGDPNRKGPGQGGPGIGQGGKADLSPAPFGVKQEVAPSIYDEKGKHLASTFIKDKSIKGEAKLQLERVAQAADADEGDDVDDTQADRRAQEVKKRYFRTMQEEAAKAK